MGYTGGSSSSDNITKEVKFIKAKESVEVGPTAEKPKIEEKRNVGNERLLNSRNQSVGKSESQAKSRPRPQRGPRSNYVCHHCGLQGHTRPNCQKLRAKNVQLLKGHEDLEMIEEIGQVNNLEIRMVIPE